MVSRTKSGNLDVQVLSGNIEREHVNSHRIRVVLEPLVNRNEIRAGMTEMQLKEARKAVTRGEE
jgi:hypothetical protein